MTEVHSINPATEAVCGTYQLMGQDEVGDCVDSVQRAQELWCKTGLQIRTMALQRLADCLRKDSAYYAGLITTEMGKPITQSLAEIEKCALLAEYYAAHGEAFLKPEMIETEFYKSYRSFQSLGIIFAIMPWNFPFWQVMRFALPNLMAGNGALLKHAPNCLGIALAIEALFRKAGFPEQLFRSLLMDIDLVPYVIQRPEVAGVTLTGSNKAGKSVAAEAGAAIKKVVLELGGSDPYVILADADLQHAAEQCVKSRFSNCGQVCIAAKRLIVVKEVKEVFEAYVIEEARKYHMGNPLDPATTIGPMARADLRLQLHDQVQRTINAGAHCVLGGSIPEKLGYYYPPTVLLNVAAESPAFTEELFGPVIAITAADNEEQALALANRSAFGLAGAIFTSDLAKGEYLAREVLQSGTCAVNTLVASDPRLPFGGIKQSGFGRELSQEGMREFVNVKTVIVKS